MTYQASVQWRLTGFAVLATLLTSLSLTPTVAEGGWGGRTLLAVSAVAVAGGLSRQLGLPRPLVPLVQTVALLLYLTVAFAGDAAVRGVLPGPAALQHLLDLLDDGLTVTWNEAPPVTTTEGVALLLVAGVGVVAIAVDALAVTWRRPTLAGLPLFVLYLVPAAVLPDGVPWPLFALAGVGWVMLQLAEGRERLARWGRLLGTGADTVSGMQSVGGTGRRLGATALAAAIVLPIVLPSLGDGVFGSGGSSGEGPGAGRGVKGLRSVPTINPLVDLRRDLVRGDDEVVLTYTTDDPTPQYLRIATLDAFDGSTWTLAELEAGEDAQAADGLPSPPGLLDTVPRTEVTTSVDVVALNSPRLPLPYPATRVDIDGDWRYVLPTLDVFTPAEFGTANGASYTATSLDVDPDATSLVAAPAPGENMQGYLEVPAEARDVLEFVTADVTAGKPSQYDQALALQNWFREEFTYSTETPPGNDTSDLEAFLDDRQGYCEQFAATMALMARVAGIPSRVQVGFTPGERLDDGSWEVTLHDAHAWPELWFERTGWVRFEPTPGGGDGNATPAWAPPPAPAVIPPRTDNGDPGRPGRNEPSLRRTGSDEDTPADDRRVPADPGGSRGGDLGASESGGTAGQDTGRTWAPYLLALLVVGALAAVAPKVAQRLEHRLRWGAVHDERTAIQAAWADVLDAATDLDLEPRPTETPRDLARRLPKQGGLSRATAARFDDLAGALEQARYRDPGSTASHAGDEREQIAAWRTVADDVCAGLFDAVSARDRRRATWWPASGRTALAARWGARSERVERWWGSVTGGISRRLRRA